MKQKARTFIEGILFVAVMVFASAMDSPDNTFPAIACVLSAFGLLFMFSMEGKNEGI